MDNVTAPVVFALVDIAVTVALAAGLALHSCRRALAIHGRNGLSLARTVLAGLAGGTIGAGIGTAALSLVAPVRHTWDFIGAQVALQVAMGMLLGGFLGVLYYRVVRGGPAFNRVS